MVAEQCRGEQAGGRQEEQPPSERMPCFPGRPSEEE